MVWIGEFRNSPVNRVSPRLVPKVPSPRRATDSIGPAGSPLRIIRQPEIDQIPRQHDEKVGHNCTKCRHMLFLVAVVIADRQLDQPIPHIGINLPRLVG